MIKITVLSCPSINMCFFVISLLISYTTLSPLLYNQQRETDDAGSSINFTTGYNPSTSSGAFRVQTADAGVIGNSGEISLRTGQTTNGNSGSILFETGSTETGEGGMILLKVGSSKLDNHGGDVEVEAGDAKDEYKSGGYVDIAAGDGTHSHFGHGGLVKIGGGHAGSTVKDHYYKEDKWNSGGDILVVSGSATQGKSGNVLISSGESEKSTSGDIGE